MLWRKAGASLSLFGCVEGKGVSGVYLPAVEAVAVGNCEGLGGVDGVDGVAEFEGCGRFIGIIADKIVDIKADIVAV